MTVESETMRTVSKTRPELAALLLVVAMFLTFLGVVGSKALDAIDRNTSALFAIEHAMTTLRDK